jgi:hypothetical protein
MIERDRAGLSIVRQCALLSLNRSGVYHRPAPESPLNLSLMRLIDEQFLETPYYRARQMARHLRRLGYEADRTVDGQDGPGGCPTPWMPISASRHWSRLWPVMAPRKSSTPIRAANIPARVSPTC